MLKLAILSCHANNRCLGSGRDDSMSGHGWYLAPADAFCPSAYTDGPECYLTTPNPVDILLNYENTYANYVQWPGPSPWVAKYDASRCAEAQGARQVHRLAAPRQLQQLVPAHARRSHWHHPYQIHPEMLISWLAVTVTVPAGSGSWCTPLQPHPRRSGAPSPCQSQGAPAGCMSLTTLWPIHGKGSAPRCHCQHVTVTVTVNVSVQQTFWV